MKAAPFSLLLFFVLACNDICAQNKNYFLFPNRVNETPFAKLQESKLFYPALSYHFTTVSIPNNVVGNGVKYDAFFCKMELKLRDKLNVWIKLHAGDYDAYTKQNYPHE